MARKKKVDTASPGDIPAWFMTYSDVITLLMTFFILLMTFATHAKERTEKTKNTMFSNAGGSGVAGEKANRPAADNWVNRIRSRSARIALKGAEMPPVTTDPATEAIGSGLRSLTEDESKQDDMQTHHVDVPLGELVDAMGNLTAQGQNLADMLATQLRDLDVHLSLQVGSPDAGRQLVLITDYLFHVQMVRPGLVGIGISHGVVPDGKVRILIERYLENR